MTDVGRFRELPTWRKDFKAAWKKASKTAITMPLNDKYKPNAKRFVCTCPQFVISRFLICKHLVQSFHPVDPIFFLQVSRNRSPPFWSHPSLVRIANDKEPTYGDNEGQVTVASTEPHQHSATCDNLGDDGNSDDELVDMKGNTWEGERTTFREDMEAHIKMIRDFCDGLEHQVQYQDRRFLKTLEKEGAGFFRLGQNCLSRERRLNSSRESSPTTWENSTSNALFYRSRPSQSDRDT